MRRVPSLPLTARIRRPLARLPLGGPTGLACAAAGVACVVGIVLARPALPFPQIHDEHRPIGSVAGVTDHGTGAPGRGSGWDPGGPGDAEGHVSIVLARVVPGSGATSDPQAGRTDGSGDGTSSPTASGVPAGVGDAADADDGRADEAVDPDEDGPAAPRHHGPGGDHATDPRHGHDGSGPHGSKDPRSHGPGDGGGGEPSAAPTGGGMEPRRDE